MNFIKGARSAFNKIADPDAWEEKASIVQQQLAEAFGAKNLSFLMGSGCSSLRSESGELGLPTMKFQANEFQTLIASDPVEGEAPVFVTATETAELHEKLGIDLTSEDIRDNLEQMLALLINAHHFCRKSENEELSSAAEIVETVIAGIKHFILHKCTTEPFAGSNESVIAHYRKFYQSLATRSRGLAPPWVFTTNYDLFNERAMDRSGVPYTNGFSGTVERRFNPATYRLALGEQLDITSRRWTAVDGFVRFCKLHGSVNWTEEDVGLFPIRESHTPLDPSKDQHDHAT